MPACSPHHRAYNKARQRLPEKVWAELVRRIGGDLLLEAPSRWCWRGREVKIVDGTTLSMPDTPANQKAYPQSASQKPGLGFPVLRLSRKRGRESFSLDIARRGIKVAPCHDAECHTLAAPVTALSTISSHRKSMPSAAPVSTTAAASRKRRVSPGPLALAVGAETITTLYCIRQSTARTRLGFARLNPAVLCGFSESEVA